MTFLEEISLAIWILLNLFLGNCSCNSVIDKIHTSSSAKESGLRCSDNTVKNYPSDLIYNCVDLLEQDATFMDLRNQPWPNIFNANSFDKTFGKNPFIILPDYVEKELKWIKILKDCPSCSC